MSVSWHNIRPSVNLYSAILQVCKFASLDNCVNYRFSFCSFSSWYIAILLYLELLANMKGGIPLSSQHLFPGTPEQAGYMCLDLRGSSHFNMVRSDSYLVQALIIDI